MIRIFNRKTQKEIIIDDKDNNVQIEPRDYEDHPYIKIIINGLNWFHHTNECENCKAFIDSFGTNDFNWRIEYSGKINRLDLAEFGSAYSQNNAQRKISEYFTGTTLKLMLDMKSVESLKDELREEEGKENYEGCRDLLDKINAIEGE